MGFGVRSVLPPAAAGDLWFAQPSYSGNEGTPLQFQVRRSNGAAGAVAVDWTVAGLTEGAPLPASGTVTWAAGDVANKTVTLTLGLVAQNRSGTITLSNPRVTQPLGAAPPRVIGNPATITVQAAVGNLPFAGNGIGPEIPTARVFISGHSLSSHIGQTYNWATGLGVNHQFERNILNGSPIEARTGATTGFNGLTDGRGEWSGSPAAAPNWLNEWETPTRVTGGKYTHLLITERHDILGPLQFHDTVRNLMWYCEAFADRASESRLIFWHPMKEPQPWPPGLTGSTLAAWIAYEKVTVRAWEAIVERVNLTARNKDFSWRLENAPMAYILARLLEECRAGTIPSITGTDAQLAALFTADGVHPGTPLGHFVVACVHAAVVHRKNITGLMGAPAGVSAARALAISTFVWNELVAYYNGVETKPTMASARTFMDTTFKTAHDAHMGYAVYSAGYFVNTNSYANPFFFDAATDTAAGGYFTPPPRFTANRWSDPATHGGSVPGPGAAVTIPLGQTWVLDTDTASLGAVTINGTLRLDGRSSTALTCSSLNVVGSLIAGTTAAPWSGKSTITLTGAGAARHITVGGTSVWDLNALAPTHRGVLNANATAGATNLAIELNRQEVTPPIAGVSQPLPPDQIHFSRWHAGHDIVVGPSDYYSAGRSEVRTLASDARPGSVTLTSGLSRARWGAKQYFNESAPTGVSLIRQQEFAAQGAPGFALAMPHEVPVDERAPLLNLTRRIVIQAANDAEWTANGNGVCITATSRNATLRLNGVALRRCGQRGAMHRNPVHLQLLSHVAGTATDLGAVPANSFVIRNCVFRESMNRGVNIRGTRGAVVEDNVFYDITGNAIYLVEGTERRNRIEGNAIGLIRAPAAPHRYSTFERGWPDVGDVNNEQAVSGIVFANGDNDIIDNWMFDSEGHGFWFGPPQARPLGDTALVDIWPRHCVEGDLRRFRSHSNQGHFGLVRGNPTALTGPVAVEFVDPTDNEQPNGQDVRIRLEEFYFFKGRGYANRVKFARYHRWTVSSTVGLGLFGASVDSMGPDGLWASRVDRPFLFGRTLNHTAEPAWDTFDTVNTPALQTWAGGASYHFSMVQFEAVVVNLPRLEGKAYSGGIRQDDLYLRPIEKGWILGPRNRYFNSDVGLRQAPPHLGGMQSVHPSGTFTLSGVIWDLYGYANGQPGWDVYNIPFHTDGATILGSPRPTDSMLGPTGALLPSTPLYSGPPITAVTVSGGEDAYIGLQSPLLHGRAPYDTEFLPRLPMTVRRLQADYATSVGGPDWIVPSGIDGLVLHQMRHFCARNGGRFLLTFPGISPRPSGLSIDLHNGYHGAGQSIMLGIEWNAAVNPAQSFFTSQWGGRTRAQNSATFRRDLSSAGSLAAVEAGSGTLYWIDSVSGVLWVKYVGDMNHPSASDPNDVYKMITLILTE